MTARILHSTKDVFFVNDLGGQREEATSVCPLLQKADACGIIRLNVAHSGLYYERRYGGWYLTSDTETCDRVHGLPPAGRLIKV